MMNELNIPKEPKGGSASRAKRDVLLAAGVALAATLLFYANALVSGSLNAGFLYTGDAWNVCVPLIAKMNALVSHGAFSGIDLSTHGGASELFLRPNLFPYHPLVLLYSLVSRSDAPQRLMRFLVLLLALHSFLGCYFAFRLSSRYLKLGTGLAVFVSLGYIFSVQMVYALFYPPYVFCATLLPWAIYGGFAMAERFSIARCMRYSMPVFIMLTAGYVPLAISSVAIAWVFLAAYLLYVEAPFHAPRARVGRLAAATLPFITAGVVVMPLYWAILQYFPLVRSAATVSVFFSAHQLAEQPRTILRLLSSRLYVAGPLYELTPMWGLIPVIISAVFFSGLRNLEELSESEWRLFKVCASAYAVIILAIYGNFSAVSDLLYFVPGVGSMHIYQRHLLAGQYFLVIPIALMFKAVVRRTNRVPAKITLFLVTGLLGACALLVSQNSPTATELHLNDYIVFELLLGTLFTAGLLIPGRWYVFLAGTFLIFIVPLGHMYDYSTTDSNRIEAQRSQQLVLDSENNRRVLSYFRAQSNKAIIKYVDLLPGPGISPYFPRNYPWFVGMELPLATYGGYDFLLAQRDAYGQRMPFRAIENVWLMRPDWKWIARTGGEFAVYQDGSRLNDPHLGEVLDVSNPSRVLRLPNNVVIAPLRPQAASSFGSEMVRGRYVRVQLAGTNILSLAEVRVIGSSGAGVSNLGQGKPARQSSSPLGTMGGAANAVDGNTNGDFKAGSVTHTDQELNAWWQVDLGTSATISSVEIWNRTDGAAERLTDYWVFVSDKPFGPRDTPVTLEHRAGTVSNHQTTTPSPTTTIMSTTGAPNASDSTLFDNGYLRGVGSEGSAVAKAFHTNGASELSLEVDASRPIRVQYLFWPNERLKFYLQGLEVEAKIEDGLQTVSIPAGHQHLEIQYVYWPLRFFLLFYCLYAVSVVAAMVVPVAVAGLASLRIKAKASGEPRINGRQPR